MVLVNVASAQPVPRGDRRGGPDPSVDRRAQVKKKIRVLRAATLTDELKLDEKTLAKLLPALAKWDDVTEDLLKKRIDIHQRLVASDGKDPKLVDKIVDEAVANQKAFWELEEKRLAELRRILTPGQAGRLLIVLPAFERRIQNQLRRAMMNAGGTRGGRAPDDDMDDDFARPRGPPKPYIFFSDAEASRARKAREFASPPNSRSGSGMKQTTTSCDPAAVASRDVALALPAGYDVRGPGS
jgi:hypothetical protein